MHSFKIKSLSEFPERSNEVLEIIHQEFNYPKEQSFAVDFYPLFNKDNYQHCHIILIGDEIIGHIGVKIRQFGIKNIWTPVALIGGIAIKKKYQGKGFFKAAFQTILNQYQNQISFFFLWSELNELYNKFDFYECGETIQFNSNQPLKTEFASYTKTKLASIELNQQNQIRNLFQTNFEQKVLGIKRDIKDWKEIADVNTTELHIKILNNQIASYFFKGKGKDLTGIIHELSEKAMDDINDQKIWASSHYKNVNTSTETIYTALVKLADFSKLNSFVSELSVGQLTINTISASEISFRFNHNNFSATPKDFLQMLFGPGQATELQSIMPPFFITGLDSV